MPPALRVCNVSGCPNETDRGRCVDCRSAANKVRRTTDEQRAYKSAGHRRMRKQVLTRDPICTLCWINPSVVADHHPLARRELVERGLDPNDPDACRGLCVGCHNKETARLQPGGFRSSGVGE